MIKGENLGEKIVESAKAGFERILDLVYPKRCVVCDGITEEPKRAVCRGCEGKIVHIRAPFCMKCGKQLQAAEEELCEGCRTKRHFFVQGTALYDYGSMADSIFRFKYCGRQEYAAFYGRQLAEQKAMWLGAVRPDALIPVPVHASRRRKRGYNQAELIAAELSKHTGIPVNTTLIVRVRKTLPQKGLGGRERQNNLKKAFKIRENDVKLKTIVIIDDIYTTGSTIDAMAEVLRTAGIQKVYFMVLAAGRGI
ncbi:MAG: ComF family protein [Lachnospiraceae bacterium]|nr:ComF family protein [Lachnospiraceae bacterium]